MQHDINHGKIPLIHDGFPSKLPVPLLMIINMNKSNRKDFMYPVLELRANDVYAYFKKGGGDIAIPLNTIKDVRTESSSILGIGRYHNLNITDNSGDEYLFNRFPTAVAKELAQIISDKL